MTKQMREIFLYLVVSSTGKVKSEMNTNQNKMNMKENE